jgi:regulator of ribonuclease activity A
MDFYTADLCDEHREKVKVLEPIFTNYGASLKCYGEIITIKLDESNHALINLLKTKVENKIAVVDVDAAYYAVVGENLMNFAHENGWKAIIINGYVRDLHATLKTEVALFALGTCPRKSFKKSDAKLNTELNFSGVTFKTGMHLYADIDGIIISNDRLH